MSVPLNDWRFNLLKASQIGNVKSIKCIYINTHLFNRSSLCQFLCPSFIRFSFIHSFIYSFISLFYFIHNFVCSFVHAFVRSLFHLISFPIFFNFVASTYNVIHIYLQRIQSVLQPSDQWIPNNTWAAEQYREKPYSYPSNILQRLKIDLCGNKKD